ncbi:MAG: hypothetical protein ABH851_06400 [Methanobacteriota archaeon]
MSPSHKHARKPVTVADLERIAVESQRAEPEKMWLGDDLIVHLEGYEFMLGVKVRQLLSDLGGRFPGEVLLAADVNCRNGVAVGDLNKLEGVEAFGRVRGSGGMSGLVCRKSVS